MLEVIDKGQRPELADVAARLGLRVEERLRVAALVVGDLVAGAVPRRAAITAEFEPELRNVLADLAGIVSGCGFLAKPGLFDDARLHHTWWAVQADGIGLARIDLDEASDTFYDYSLRDFFSVPASTGQIAVDGPYVDYLGTNEYILTWGVPVTISGAFIGVLGADVTLQDLQRYLLSTSPRRPRPQAMVTSRGRVIYSTVPKPAPGSMVRSADLVGWFTEGDRVPSRAETMDVWPCAGLPWAVLELTPVSQESE